MPKTNEENVKTQDKKEQMLNEALKQIEKQYGKGSIMKLGEHATTSTRGG